ncbi:YwdI family protein [Neobacillus terrae]|uniref:YwdI family protein n=1 Tax=Neobacillus terrae TaxID=3034837 RepID=UPI00140AA2F1|nr:YwdI family protein [Neobacillus terrae]NHM30148.1 YwdI family protein [Neobacillus terrae]
MNISFQKLLTKMEEELREARKSSNESAVREKIYSIKILCELLLEQEKGSSQGEYSVPAPQPILQIQPAFSQPVQINQPKKLDEGDANGDSLFDF